VIRMGAKEKLYRIRGLIWLAQISAVVILIYDYFAGNESWIYAFVAFLVAKFLLRAAKPKSVE